MKLSIFTGVAALVVLLTASKLPYHPISRAPLHFAPVEVRVSDALAKSVDCMTEAIYYEAAEEPTQGQLAVGTVIMNRLRYREFGTTICGVVYRRSSRGCQFSWVCGRRIAKNPILYQRARKAAVQVVLDSVRVKAIRGAIFFHNTTMRPSWADTYRFEGQIGHHLFYAPPKAG